MISLDNILYHSTVSNQVSRLIEEKRFLKWFASLGYRHVHLYTIGGDLIANAYLFVHIVINSKSLAVVSSLLSRKWSAVFLIDKETSSIFISLSSFIITSEITCSSISSSKSSANRWTFQSRIIDDINRWFLHFFLSLSLSSPSRLFNLWKRPSNIVMLLNKVFVNWMKCVVYLISPMSSNAYEKSPVDCKKQIWLVL